MQEPELHVTGEVPDEAAPAGDVIIADGAGNVQSSSVQLSSLMVNQNRVISVRMSAHLEPENTPCTVARLGSSSVLSIGGSYGLFVPSDVGKNIVVEGAGANGANLNTTIATYISPTSVTLASNASTTVTIAIVAWYSASRMTPQL